MQAKQHGYSETKPSLNSTLDLAGDGSYTAKFEEIDYTGTWTEGGGRITLKPKTYMGMERANFPQTKSGTSAGTIDMLYKPYELDESADGKSLAHTDTFGTVTFSKSG